MQADAGTARLSLKVSGPVHARITRLGSPARVVIDLPATARAASWRAPAAAGMINGVYCGARGRGYRVVLQLRTPVSGVPKVSLTRQAGAYQVLVTFSATRVSVARGGAAAGSSAGATAHLAAAAGAGAGADAAADSRVGAGSGGGAQSGSRVVRPTHMPAGRDVVVAIDAGHGGEDPGASGAGGTHEKDVVLSIARRLAALLDARPGMRAVLTRDGDRFIPLRERMDRARSAHADLFVSIHADAVRDRSIAGASVYTVSDRGASNEAARWLADRENAADLRGGVSLADVDQNLASVLLSVSQSAIMADSAEAAGQVLGALDQVGAVRKSEVQHAAFVVLKSPDLPSMLVETAYISNPDEERKLRSSAYQAQLAGAIEAGIVGYFQRHPPDGRPLAVASVAEHMRVN